MRRLAHGKHYGDMWQAIRQFVRFNGKRNRQTSQEISSFAPVPAGIHIIHTSYEATAFLLGVADSFAGDPHCAIHIHAALPIPYHLELDNHLISVQHVEHLLGDCVLQFGPPSHTYSVHVRMCRTLTDGLLKSLPPRSLVLIGAKWRPWTTTESRFAKAIESAGHRLFSIHLSQQQATYTGDILFARRGHSHVCEQNAPAQ